MICDLREIHNWLAVIDGRETVKAAPKFLILCGSSVLETVHIAARVFHSTEPHPFLIVTGGVGHSTSDLSTAAVKKYHGVDFSECTAEADFFGRILCANFGISRNQIILERESTNCGSNA